MYVYINFADQEIERKRTRSPRVGAKNRRRRVYMCVYVYIKSEFNIYGYIYIYVYVYILYIYIYTYIYIETLKHIHTYIHMDNDPPSPFRSFFSQADPRRGRSRVSLQQTRQSSYWMWWRTYIYRYVCVYACIHFPSPCCSCSLRLAPRRCLMA